MMFNRTMHGTQRGVATILIVLLIALSLTAAVLLGVQYNRSLQEQSISLHAQTAAQSKAWETAEIVRQYFDELQKGAGFDTLFTNIENELAGNNVLALNGLDNTATTTATLQNAWKDSDDIPHFGVLIESTAAAGTKAEAKARLEVVVSYAGNIKKHGLPTAGHFLGDTNLTGGIKIYTDKEQVYNISVDGNVTIGKGNVQSDKHKIAGINSIISTKSIQIDNIPNTFEKLHANCDIKLKSSSAKYIHARNNICLINSKTPKGENNLEVTANGSVYIDQGDWGAVTAWTGLDQSCPENADVLCTNNEVPNPPGIELIHPATAESQQTGSDTVELVDVASATLNVSDLEKYANYIFDHDTVVEVGKNGKETVTTRILAHVKNVHGINPTSVEETFKLDNNKLCRLTSNECFGPITNNKGSIKYTKANDLWTVEGSIAPGFVIFRGGLFLGKGTFINTIGATKNIEMKGDKVYSLNYSGTNGKRDAAAYAPHGVCAQMATGNTFYPSNLCENGKYLDEGVIEDYGNYGLLATININLQSNTSVFGAIKAGSALTAESNTTAYGYVSGLGGDVQHTLKGFTIDLTNLPDGYKLVENETEQNSEGANEANAVILWSRYQ